jgi:selenocysteine-specific elongation factor
MGLAARDHDPLANLSEDQRHRLAQIESRYRKAGLAPLDPEPNGPDPLDQDLTALLLDSATLVVLQNVSLKQTITLHAETLAAAAATLGRAFPVPAYFTTGEARVALSTSRKVIVPILEYFDARGLTQRSGDMRQMREANSISPPAATC